MSFTAALEAVRSTQDLPALYAALYAEAPSEAEVQRVLKQAAHAAGASVTAVKSDWARYRKATDPATVSAADRLSALALKHADLWHDSESVAFATVRLQSGGQDNLPVDGPAFKSYLGHLWYSETGQGASKEAVERARDSVAAKARYDAPCLPTAVRFYHADGVIWLDLNDPDRRVVRADRGGWQIVQDHACPVRFLRPKHMGALPEPKAGGSLDRFLDLLSVAPESRPVVAACLLGAFLPTGAVPILVATGEQGSGKSFGCRALRALIDPASPSLRRAPKEDRDLIAALTSGWVLAFDNLSGIPGWLSDALCSLATGGGLACRKLYTDGEEHIVQGRRPVILNGINDVAKAPDLAERCLFAEFTRPPVYREEADLSAALEREYPLALGALLDRVCRALRVRDTQVPPGPLPRMADFARWAYAGTPASERDATWAALEQNRSAKSWANIENDLAASAVFKLAQSGRFEGTARELLATLELQEGFEGRNRPEGWPKSASGLGGHLTKYAPDLMKHGVLAVKSRGRLARSWTVSLVQADLQRDTSRDTSGRVPAASVTQSALSLNLNGAHSDTRDTCDTSSPTLGGSAIRTSQVGGSA